MTGVLSIAAAAWSGVLGVVATWAAIRTRARPDVARDDSLPALGNDASILLLRPCAGSEPHLERALRSSRTGSPGEHTRVRIRFLVAQAGDGAMPAAARVNAELTAEGRDAKVVVTGAHAPNMKAAQLARAIELESTASAFLLVADSDVELSKDTLASLLAPLVRGDAVATWMPAVETAASTRADRASAAVLDASLHAFPLLVGLDPAGMVGKCFAVRRDALDATGGFAALVEHLGEDVELARRLRRRGGRVLPCRYVVRSLATGRSWRDVIQRYARWVAVVRSQRTSLLVSYPALLAATPLVLALAMVGLARGEASASWALAFALLVRLGVAVIARRRARVPVRPLSALLAGLVADSVLLAAFARALTCRVVVWRGARLPLAPQGLLGRER